MTTRVLLADDQELVRAGFSSLIAATPHLHVVGEASTGREALELTRAHRPHVVLMDIRMPEMDGIEATHIICADPHLERTRVVILTTFDADAYVYEALRAGASGFLLKDTPPAQLLHAIDAVAAGDALIAPSITRRLIDQFTNRPDPDAGQQRLAALTVREIEVLEHVARGHNNHEIAEALHMSPATAKTHVTRIIGKLAVRDRAQLVIIAYETGLVTPGGQDD